MSVTGHDHKEHLIEWARRLAALASQRDVAAAQDLRAAVDQYEADRFSLAVVGKAKRGKSTLVNALLGRTNDVVAPIDKLPASAAVSKFRVAANETATVVFRDGHREAITYTQIRDFVTEEKNPENAKEVVNVEISGPFSGLDADLDLVDTPGAGSLHEHHDLLLHGFLPHADAVLFLVTARMPLDRDELELLQKLKAADVRKIFFVVNRVDETTPEDVDAAVAHNRRLLAEAGIPVERFLLLSAKRAFLGEHAASGLDGLRAALAEFLAAEKGRVLAERLTSRVLAAVEPLCAALDLETASLAKSSQQLDAELSRLGREKQALEGERAGGEREFLASWDKALVQLEGELRLAQSAVERRVAAYFSEVKLTEIGAAVRQLPTTLNEWIDDEAGPPARRFEEATRNACAKLQADYPQLLIGKAGIGAVRGAATTGLAAGAAGGLATAAAGGALALAGSSAAAGIAAASAVTTATTVAAPSVVSSALTYFGLAELAGLATGSVTVAAPSAVATPLWVAMAGPVGWTLAGVGLLAIPWSWRIAKVKQRDKLERICSEQVQTVFNRLAAERIPALQRLGRLVGDEFRARLERQYVQIETALASAREHRDDPHAAQRVRTLAEDLQRQLAARPQAS